MGRSTDGRYPGCFGAGVPSQRQGITPRRLGLAGRKNAAIIWVIWALVVLLTVAASGCDNNPQPRNTPISTSTLVPAPTSTPARTHPGEPPFAGLEQLVEHSDLSLIGRVASTSQIRTVFLGNDPSNRAPYYEASVEVERILFGLHHKGVVVHVPAFYVADEDIRRSTNTPQLEVGEKVILFLTQQDRVLDLRGSDFVITGGGPLWGKLAVEDDRAAAPYPTTASGSEPLDEVAAWIGAARFSRAKPGTLAGEVSGLDEGDSATFRLLELGRSHRLENGVLQDEWTLGNGPWEKRDLRLSQGTYVLVYEARGYLPLHRPEGLMFDVPSEGIDWRARGLKFAFFRPKDADDKPFDNGTGWLPERSVRGQVAGIPHGVDATVRIRRLPPAQNELYIIGPSLREGTSSFYPPELTCLEVIDDPDPEKTVALMQVQNGRWGLSDPALQGSRYLITIEAPGLQVSPAGYVAVVFGGKAPHRLRGVDFRVGDSEASACDTGRATSAPTRTSPGTLSSIEAVYSMVASRPMGDPLNPLFADQPDDGAVIARLALAIETAIPIMPTDHLSANDRGRYLSIRFRNGTELTVRQVSWCEQWDGRREFVGGVCRGRHETLSDIWWVEGRGMVESPALALWWREKAEFMAPIGYVGIPETIMPGEPFRITSCCWEGIVQAETIKLSLVSAGGLEIGLGEFPISSGITQRNEIVPYGTQSGRYWLHAASSGFSEVVDVVQVETGMQPPNEILQRFTDARPSTDWRLVEAPGWPSQPGFYLRLPPGWELNELQGIDSYGGEVIGDGMRLTFDYGGFSWILDPSDDPDHTYAVAYEDIGGFEAKLLISLDDREGYTGVYFEGIGGPSLNLVGEGLTPEQQHTAISVFRGIRLRGQ